MRYAGFLFGFSGRINRAKYWLANLMILALMFFSLLLLMVICTSQGISTGPLSINLLGISASIKFTHDDAPAALFPRLATLVMTLALGWCYAAASIKRLHDRNKSGWWIVPYIAAAGLCDQFGDWFGDSWPAVLVGYAVFIAFIWGFGRVVLPERNVRAQPVWARPAGAGYRAALGPAKRARICSVQCWPIGRPTC